MTAAGLKAQLQHPESSTGKHAHPLHAHSPLSALSFRELNRKINLFIETEVKKKKKKKNHDERVLKAGKEDRSKVCWEISRGQDVGLSVEQIPFGKQSSVYKRQNDSYSNTGRLAGFIYKTNY